MDHFGPITAKPFGDNIGGDIFTGFEIHRAGFAAVGDNTGP